MKKNSIKSNDNTKTKLCGKEGFEAYYSALYGERWPLLKKAFAGEGSAVEFHVRGAEQSYFLDSASVLAALCLPLEGASDILDLCAAPGGKTLILASRMPKNARLSSNERSPERKHRLSVVVQNCLPSEISSRVVTSCSDGATWCTRQTECFDRILLDAPCSSERHVIADPKYLNTWSPSRVKTVATEQWALLSSAYRLLRVGGILLYSTCALCPQENDEMIERLYKKFNKNGTSFSVLAPDPQISQIQEFCCITLPEWEKTKYGCMILPDRQNGAGPIFFSIIRKEKTV